MIRRTLWKKFSSIVVIAFIVLFGILFSGCSTKRNIKFEVTLSSVLKDLTNINNFADIPLGRMKMLSTYDRTGGNNDWGDFSRIDSKGLVTIADLKGPGCVKRIWMTNVPAKRFLFFIDGEKVPRINVSGKGLFLGEEFPFEPPLCNDLSGGTYSYLPIPFAKSLKIIAVANDDIKNARPYYQVNYEVYDNNVKIISFPENMGNDEKLLLQKVRNFWRKNKELINELSFNSKSKKQTTIEAGKTLEWINYKGEGILRSFQISISSDLKISALQKERLLRQVIVRIFWDGSSEPSVEVPLGDFFCNGLHWREFSSMPLASRNNKFICRFPMPFRKSVRAELRNDGQIPVILKTDYDLVKGLQDKENVCYFHANWNHSMSSGIPYRVLRTSGEGHYVGCYLTALGMDGTWNILEGDESIFIDGETVPSIHGTGLEDYFNSGWYYYGLFELPLHGLLEKAAMRTSQYRFHLTDPVAFKNGLFVTFEFGDGNKARGYMSSTAFWYQSVPVSAGTKLPAMNKRFPPFDPVGKASLMSELFELERVGLFRNAMERCLAYAEKLGGSTESNMLKLRAEAYKEELKGYESVRNAYENFASNKYKAIISEQAKKLIWFNESENNALLGAHMNGQCKLYIDGKQIGAGDNPFAISVFPVTIKPGEHELTVEMTPSRHSAWLSIYLRTHSTNIVTDVSWEYSKEKPGSWPLTSNRKIQWTHVASSHGMLPGMQYWHFIPNAFIKMQSGRQLLQAWAGWDKQPGMVTTYLRKKFIIH